jgi:dolichyl-phosphate-mannose-protein mannosyltransferase
MVGLFLVALIGFSVIYDLWMLLDIKRGLSMVNTTSDMSWIVR